MSDVTSDNNTSVSLLDQPEANPARGRPAPDPLTAASIRRRWTDAVHAQRIQQIQYWLNRSHLYGDQWVEWNRTLNKVINAPLDESRVHATVNRLWPGTRTLLAKLLRRELTFEVEPTEADDATVGGAEIGESVLTAAHRDQDWENVRAEHAMAAWLGGTGVLFVDWDTQGGTPLGLTEQGREYGTGDVVVSACSIIEVATEPGAHSIERARWAIRAQALPPKQVQAMFHLAKTPAADAAAGIEPVGQRYLGEGGNGPLVTQLALVLRYYERPSWLNPRGAVAIVVGGEIVDGPHPWPFPFTDRLNCAAARETRVEGRWSGNTVFSAARPVQTLLNAAESNIAEHMKLAGNARLMLPDAALDGISDLSDLPAEIIPWSGQGTPPAWLAPPNMPAWWLEQPQCTSQSIDDILGVHDATPPDQPPPSGFAMSLIAEADDTPIAGFAKELAECWGRTATLALEIYAANVTETRTARVSVGTKMPLLVRWTGKDLAGQTTARVPLDSVMPRSRAAQMQWAVSLMSSGVIPPGNTQLFAQLAELPDQEAIFEGIDAQVAKARRENLLLSIGQVCVPQHFDDHPKHIAEHNRQRLSARYDRSSKALRQILDDHVKAHEMLEVEATGAQMAAQAASPEYAAAAKAHEPTPVAPPPPGMPPPAGAPAPQSQGPGPPDASPPGAPQAPPAPPDATQAQPPPMAGM